MSFHYDKENSCLVIDSNLSIKDLEVIQEVMKFKNEAEKAIERVRALHSPNGSKGYSHLKSETGLWCAACDESSMGEYGMPYPCPTIRALDGEELLKRWWEK